MMSKPVGPRMARPTLDEDLLSGDLGPSTNPIERLFREHNDSLLRFLRTRLRSDADAREAAQEAYVRLLQLDQADQPSFLRAYLFKIAANVATDMLRRRSVRARQTPTDESGPSDFIDQEEVLDARQQMQLVQEAIDELPPRCRQAFLLKRDDEMATLQIGEQLGVSDRMVRIYLTRAIEHIQHALERQERPA
jgi:RNA polymerase sigma factor (sigma-70 family)